MVKRKLKGGGDSNLSNPQEQKSMKANIPNFFTISSVVIKT